MPSEASDAEIDAVLRSEMAGVIICPTCENFAVIQPDEPFVAPLVTTKCAGSHINRITPDQVRWLRERAEVAEVIQESGSDSAA